MAYKDFTNGSVLPASDVNTYLMDQMIMTFANASARATAIGTPVAGMITYLVDVNTFEYWDGTVYKTL